MRDRDTVVRRLAIGGVVLSATILSYSTLHHRAVTIGIPEWSAWFYPVLYDAFILAASRMWQNPELSDRTRNLAKNATLGTIAAALLMFVGEFLPRGPVATLSSLMIPAVLATALVLMSRSAADRKVAPEKSVAEPKETPAVVVPDPAPEPVAAKLEGNTAVVEKPEPPVIPTVTFEPTDEITQWINVQLDAGVDVTGAVARARFPQLKGNASRKVKAVKDRRANRNGHKVIA